jgi:hypothetical protein
MAEAEYITAATALYSLILENCPYSQIADYLEKLARVKQTI